MTIVTTTQGEGIVNIARSVTTGKCRQTAAWWVARPASATAILSVAITAGKFAMKTPVSASAVISPKEKAVSSAGRLMKAILGIKTI